MKRPLTAEELLEAPPQERCANTSDLFSGCPTCNDGICTSRCTDGKAGAKAKGGRQQEESTT